MSAPRRVLGALLLAVSPAAGAAQGQAARGRATFDAMCAACHTVGGGRLVGPDLQGITGRRSETWLIEFVQHPQRFAAGDTAAAALIAEYGFPMPDQPLSGDEIRAILAYIGGTAPGAAAAPLPQAAPVGGAVTDEQVTLGRALFQGRARLANAGPSCISCHDVTYEGVAPGGALARELTTAVARLGSAGARAIVAQPPFPVMQRAYRDRPLTAAEVTALMAFLTRVSERQGGHQARAISRTLPVAGAVGAALLLLLYSLVWGKRLKHSVNQRIYERQLEST